jgi:tRNA dimethylallyltransferase
MERLVAIVGPTGIGKSRLALHLSTVFPGEIVSADSRQVYRFLDIGTAKPSPEDLSRVPHHLIDIINPDEEFSLAQYQELAFTAIADIQRRRHLPFLVGGSGLYVKAVLENWQIPRVSPDPRFRYNIGRLANGGGADELYRELAEIDPVAAQKIDRRNVRRVIRALEVHARTGRPFSGQGKKGTPGFQSLVIGLTTDRSSLYEIVDRRVDDMFARGLVAEVENLLKMGYDFNLPALSGIGYRQVGQYLRGELSLDEARYKMKIETHRLIRHQYAWFRLKDETIRWFDVAHPADADIEETVNRFLNADS